MERGTVLLVVVTMQDDGMSWLCSLGSGPFIIPKQNAPNTCDIKCRGCCYHKNTVNVYNLNKMCIGYQKMPERRLLIEVSIQCNAILKQQISCSQTLLGLWCFVDVFGVGFFTCGGFINFLIRNIPVI